MNRTNLTQKKNNLITYIYAGVIALLILACAVVIAVVNINQTTNLNIGEEVVQVSANNFVVPMKNATISKDYSGSELQYNETLKQWEIHKAIDFIPADDLNVYAVAEGTVSNVYTNYLEGTVVEISHSNGIISIYKSLAKEVKVSVGEKVGAGLVIGSVSANMAQELKTGAHLHFEMTKNGAKINPNDYLDLGNK